MDRWLAVDREAGSDPASSWGKCVRVSRHRDKSARLCRRIHSPPRLVLVRFPGGFELRLVTMHVNRSEHTVRAMDHSPECFKFHSGFPLHAVDYLSLGIELHFRWELSYLSPPGSLQPWMRGARKREDAETLSTGPILCRMAAEGKRLLYSTRSARKEKVPAAVASVMDGFE